MKSIFPPMTFARLHNRLFEPVDISSLVFFRVVFGLAIVIGVVRYLGYGWVTQLYIEPTYHFTYWGFDWVRPWPGSGMYVHYAVMGILGACISVGLFYRASIILFFFMFIYVELIDKTAYLNHYYFVSLVALLLIFMPLGRAYSLDARRNPQTTLHTIPAWMIWTLRLQLGCVYFFAGLAKLEKDWLLNGEPMSIWLASKTDMWLIGPFFDLPWLGQVMSIAGCIFDLTIFFFLLWGPSRVLAYITVVVFHLFTGLLFNIGLFPLIMIGLTPIFFAPDWPRKIWSKIRKESNVTQAKIRGITSSNRRQKIIITALAIYFSIQIFLPLRHWLYPGNVLWNQEGWRFSWRVMLVEKSGSLRYKIFDPDSGKRWVEYPEKFLTARQLQLTTGSPDMILQLAHDLATQYRQKGYSNVEVYAESHISLNGRPSQRLVNPDIDLSKQRRGLGHFDWILEPSN